jgi:uncharacterized protein YutE (UPF0331/DUF86 family)
MAPDKATLFSLLDTLREAQQKLTILKQVPQADFIEDFTKVESAKHLLQVSVQACIDMAHHIIAEKGWRTPQSSADAFIILQEAGLFPAAFLPTLQNMVRFRNRVVHLYWDVNAETVYQIVQNNLQDFDEFAQYLLHFIEQDSPD